MIRFMNKSVCLIMGILFILLGIFSLWNPEFIMLSFIFLAGCMFLCSGISNILFYFSARPYLFASGWFLADGIISFLLGIFLFFNHQAVLTVLPYIIGMWMIFTGVSNLIKSFDLYHLEISGWWVILLIGILEAGLGFASLWHPFIAMLATSSIVGWCFLMQGLALILLWWFVLKYMDRTDMNIFY